MSAYNKMQLVEAIKYLRGRRKYIVDKDCGFKPVSAAATDVVETFEAYRKDVLARESSNIRKFK